MTAVESVQHLDRLFVGGSWVEPSSSETITVISPHTEEPVATVAAASPADVDRAVVGAHAALIGGEWSRRSPEERIEVVSRLADAYRARMPDIAAATTREMGAPISIATGLTRFASFTLDTFVEMARDVRWEEPRAGATGPLIVRREPVGVVAAIVPWNVPQFLIMTKLAPALLAGCSIVVKPAPETPLDALVLAEVIEEAGLPAGVVSILPADREAAESLVRHPLVDKVAFTGSTATGRRIGAICGEQLKRFSLELGGKSASIVLDDADLGAMVSRFFETSIVNSGQVCVAHTRILVHRTRHDDLVDALSGVMSMLPMGDPQDPSTLLGPVVSERQFERVQGYIGVGQSEGARVAVGGSGRPDHLDRGWYVKPTLFVGADNSMRIAQEEIFGPVITVIPFDDEAEAVRLANDTPYGLAGAVWTADRERGLEVAHQIRTGTIGVNVPSAVDVKAPFGGFKQSGLGRELGPEGFDSYVEIKTLSVAPPP